MIHPGRPELGVGEVGDAFEGTPAIIQVYWPLVDKYGFYRLPDLLRVKDSGPGEGAVPAVDEPIVNAPPI